jgi:hypothetical protein
MSVRPSHPATQPERRRRAAVVQVASTMEWLDRPQMQEAMDLVLKDRVHLEFNDTANVQGYGAMYEVAPNCPCDEGKPCVHEQAVILARQVETALAEAAAEDPWAEAILEAATTFHLDHPEVDQGRIGRGVDLATSHAVAFRTDGSALVTNGGVKRPVTYIVTLGAEEQCNCEDVHKRHITWCKHSIAVQLTEQARQPQGLDPEDLDDVPNPDVSGWEKVGEDEPLPILVQEPDDLITRVHQHHDPAMGPATAPAPAIPSGWNVNEAPAVAWFKWRVGNSELFYSFRDMTDDEVQERVAEKLPHLQALVADAETRQAEADAARQELLAKARQAESITFEVIRAIAQEEIGAAVDRAAAAKAQAKNGEGLGSPPTAKPSAPPPRQSTPPAQHPAGQPRNDWCYVHGVKMQLRQNARGTWYSHRLDDGEYCKGEA